MEQQPKIAALPEDFWAEEDQRNQELDSFLKENKMGGYASELPPDAYAEDDDAEAPVQTDETAPESDEGADSEEMSAEETEPQADDIDEAVNELTKRKPM